MSSVKIPGIDPMFYALSKYRRRKFDECITICTELLEANPLDQAVWFLKTRALTAKSWIDDTELEEEGVAEVLLDEHGITEAPRPGTSLNNPNRPTTGVDQSIRPVSASGRPITGFLRPGTSSHGSASRGNTVDGAFRSNRPGTSRPMTSLGRQVRLGTASMRSDPGGVFINVDRLDMNKYARRPTLAKALCDYLIYHEHNPRKAMELAAKATQVCEFKDWWWKARLGKCYYQLGLYRDAEKQYKSALRQQPISFFNVLELSKIYIRLDLPNNALELFQDSINQYITDPQLLLGIGRIYDMLNNVDKSIEYYKKVLQYDSSNIEALANLASHHFYSDQPEIALRYYRRLLQMGVTQNSELWNNMGLCCYYSSQYDLALTCFERAINLGTDETLPDIWYNIGQIAISLGESGLAYQCFKICVSLDNNHIEAYNNLGILELRKGAVDAAKANFRTAQQNNDHIYEPFYNSGLLSYKMGDFQESYKNAEKSLEIYPEHSDSQELMKQLKQHFTSI